MSFITSVNRSTSYKSRSAISGGILSIAESLVVKSVKYCSGVFRRLFISGSSSMDFAAFLKNSC